MDLFNRSKDKMHMVEVIRLGMFGAYEYKIGKYHFEQKEVFRGKRFGPTEWYMTVNGKTSKIPFKYVLVLTYKAMKLI